MGKLTNLVQRAVVEHEWRAECYVNFDKLKKLSKDGAKHEFVRLWKQELGKVSAFAFKEKVLFNTTLFDVLGIKDFSPEDHQLGLKHAELIKQHKMDNSRVTDLQGQYSKLAKFVKVNYQLLLGSVRRYIKHNNEPQIFLELIPELVASNLSTYNSTSPSEKKVVDTQSGVNDATLVGLKQEVSSISNRTLGKLVAHRGYHDGKLGLHRPLENTLAAFEQAWAAGVEYCECDVHATKDGHLVVHHDATLHRLALHPNDKICNKDISELTLEEFKSVPLLNGSTSCALVEILDTAIRFGPTSRLVVEMKAGPAGVQAVKLLHDLLEQHPKYAQQIGIIMSFDLQVMTVMGEVIQQASYTKPKLMFLLAKPENGYVTTLEHFESLDIEEYYDGSLDEQIDSWLQPKENIQLDGLYIEYDTNRFQTEKGMLGLLRLAEKCTLGIWKNATDPDTLSSIVDIESCGAKYHNTDFPAKFSVL